MNSKLIFNIKDDDLRSYLKGCNGEGLERNRRDLEIEPTMESDMKVSNRVLTMGPLMVAVNDLLVETSSSRLADEGKFRFFFYT